MAKISELLASAPVSSFDGTEAFHAVEDPTGTPASKGGLISQIRTYIRLQLGVASGFASLNASGKVPLSQLDDNVEEYANLAAFPGTGDVGVVYIALDTDLSYIWDDDGSVYVLQSKSGSLPSNVGLKTPCRRVATSNVDIATGGIVSIDGGNTVNNDRILLVGQTAPAENGIYICNSAGAWSRASDANVVSEVRGSFVSVWQGTTYGSSLWFTDFKQGNTLGTTAMNWYQIATGDNIIALIDALLGSSGWQGGGYTDEQARDAIGTALVEGNGIDITVNDAGDTITIATTKVGSPFEMLIAVSDETTALTTGTGKVTFRMPHKVTLSEVRASVTTAPTGSTLIVDINEGGSTILSTKLSIDASEKTSTTAASAAVISDTSLADDAEMTIDIDQVGSTIAGAGLKVLLIGTYAA